MKNKKYLFLFLIIPILVIFISRSFSLRYTQEIKKVEIQSSDYNNPGSWHIDKSAEWTDFGKARVTFDVSSVMKTSNVRYKDVIFVMDVSGSMSGSKLNRAKQDAIDLTNYLLSDSHNSIALITFDTTSEVISGFINDKDQMVNYITNLTDKGCTNYNAGLLNADIVMENYVKEDNKDLVLLFLTDGYPNEDTPNQVATYTILKDKYPYMTINGIQYEMGKDIIQEIIDVSDNQFIADQDNLNNVLFDATVAPVIYDNFVVTDYINDDYFYVESVNDIEVPFGEVSLNTENGVQKITWNLGNNYVTGKNVKMFVNLKLKEEFHNTKGFYPTNKSETIKSKLPEEDEKTVNSTLTPVLKNVYYVIYDTNTPNGCNISEYAQEEHYVYQNIEKKTESLVCPGYLFKGWIIDDTDKNDMTIINDDMFIMPSHDVHIRAIWGQHDLVKKMDGTVREKATLYKVLQNEANIGTYAQKYTGPHQDSFDNSGTSDIYYYYASDQTDAETIIKEKNNVIFANHCWQMYRTTDTGGVKLIYNGEPTDDKCMNTVGSITGRSNHIGYSGTTSKSLLGTYYYGTDYTYENNKFKLSGTIHSQTISNDNASSVIPTLVGKYTCVATTSEATCERLYLIERYIESTSSDSVSVTAKVIQLYSSSLYSQFGVLPFNEKSTSPADIGYMYNNRYDMNYKSHNKETIVTSASLSTSYWYADSIEWGNPVANRYNLVNAYKVSSTNDYNNLVGKYTFRSSNQTYTNTTVYYIAAINGSTMYYIELKNSINHDLSDYNYKYTFGDNYQENDDGTYTITNKNGNPPTSIYRIDWYDSYTSQSYNNFLNKFICRTNIDGICNELWHITAVGSTNFYYSIKGVNEYKYASEFEYKLDSNDGVYKYFLKDDDSVSFWIFNSENFKLLNTHRYTCWNTSGVCEQISYIYYDGSLTLYYININDGKDASLAVQEMLYLDNDDYHINTKNSIIKTGVDAWYKKYIYNDFDQYVEDTIFCNSRTQRNSNTNGWNPNSENISYDMSFNAINDLSCINETDKFSIYNNKAQLTYKVGLATYGEMSLLNNHLKKTSQIYELMSPMYIYNGNGYMNSIYTDGRIGYIGASGTSGVRPVVSLIPGIEYTSGDGSMENPYIVDTSDN
jgi:uncharacterized protein YegL